MNRAPRTPDAPAPAVPLPTRRTLLKGAAGAAAAAAATALSLGPAQAETTAGGPMAGDAVILCNEDSNTLSVIDPTTNSVATTINLTSFDEDPRPPFRFVTGGVTPTHGGMVQKPLYHGAISIHGCVPSPDSRFVAVTGRGSSNVYLADTTTRRVVGNGPNPQATEKTNPDRITSGILVGREPHEPTFTRNGRELWVCVRGEDRIAVLDVEKAIAESHGAGRGSALRGFVPSLPGPAHVWFSKDGRLAFVVSQKTAAVDVLEVSYGGEGFSTVGRRKRLDITAADRFGFSPFLKLSPDGEEMWISHKLADAVSVLLPGAPQRLGETVALGEGARPNHVEFAENARGRVAYVSCARVDDGGPGDVAASRIAIVDRSAPVGRRRVVGSFFSHGREAHGLWTDPAATRLYVAHEQDELPGTPNAGQTVCTVFDIDYPLQPGFLAQIPLGALGLPSGQLRNRKSINLVYVRPGSRSASA
ncbi:YncE family protein [Chelatococcus sp. SYSU_G07232]|uniref:YncE family protein n=1 Tax=Chelatococcus albus TaxID=3047466 RepID=A0ABT7AE46_9HYPH|nr:YncE family protein [Chelatococcus sp. SYSU_G07232]MDJ1157613.1 YncE family protein [Chelatococcus sp. SYSU_G07232]